MPPAMLQGLTTHSTCSNARPQFSEVASDVGVPHFKQPNFQAPLPENQPHPIVKHPV